MPHHKVHPFYARISNFFFPPPSLLELDVVVLYFSCSKGILYAFLCSSFLVTHSVGRRMVYPGSVMLLQKAMWPMLLQGQAKLVEEVETTHTFWVCLCGKNWRCWPSSLYFLTVWRSEEQAVGLWWEWDRHHVCRPKESRGSERSDPGKGLQLCVV